MNIVTVTPGSLIDDTVDGYVIDTILLDSSYSSPITILAGNTDMPSNVAFETSYANISCTPQSSFLDITPYSCTGSTVSTDFYVGSQHDLEITIGAIPPPPPPLPAPSNVIDAPLNTEIISNVVAASNISSPVNISVTNGDLRINGGSWVTSGQITSNGDQVEYRTQVTQEGERKLVAINLNGINSQWVVDAYSCFTLSVSGTIRYYDLTCSRDVVIPSVLFGQSIEHIDDYAFSYGQITSVIIPSSVVSIGDSAFEHNQLTSVIIPSSVVSIDNRAFRFNQLTSVNIPDSITIIGAQVFEYNNLTSVTIPDNITSIYDMAFNNNKLTSITI